MEPADIDLAALVSLAGGGVVRAVIDRMSDDGLVGIKPSHGYVIQRLVDDEPTISSLASSLGMTQQGASKQVGDLERLGYVERIPVPGDQRARKVRLTTAGRAVLDGGRKARADIESQVADRVGAEAVQTAKVVLASLLEVVGLDDRVRARSVPAPQE